MKKEKTKITQELCRKVQIMLAGAKAKEVAGLLGISETTVSRIKAAGFSAEQYEKNTAARKAEEKKPEVVLKPFQMDPPPAEEQCAGQISMDELQPAEDQKPEMSDTVKLMRFLAGKFDELDKKREADELAINIQIKGVMQRIDRVTDYLAQILRKMDG